MSSFLLLAMYISETTKVFGVYIKQHCKGWNRLKHSLLIFEIFNCFKTALCNLWSGVMEWSLGVEP